MQKNNKINNKGLTNDTTVIHKTAKNTVTSVSPETENQSHNIKKEALGPNIKR